MKQKEADLLRVSAQTPPEPLAASDLSLGEVEVSSKWTNNWLGDDRWLDVLLKGDPDFQRDRLLEVGYDKAIVRHHSLVEDDGTGKSTNVVSPTGLGALEKQVEEQKKRVIELKKLREGALKSLGEVREVKQEASENSTTDIRADSRKGLQVSFNRHMVTTNRFLWIWDILTALI